MRWLIASACLAAVVLFTTIAVAAEPAPGDESAQWGGSPARNNVHNGQHLPKIWNVGQFDDGTGEWLPGSGKNIRWVTRLGTVTGGVTSRMSPIGKR